MARSRARWAWRNHIDLVPAVFALLRSLETVLCLAGGSFGREAILAAKRAGRKKKKRGGY
jgi:hypothetical protein